MRYEMWPLIPCTHTIQFQSKCHKLCTAFHFPIIESILIIIRISFWNFADAAQICPDRERERERARLHVECAGCARTEKRGALA